MPEPKIALCLPGGGVTGAMFQVGALAALEDTVEGLDVSALDLYVGASTGAAVAAALAGGQPVQRIYRALLDPSDVYLPLERRHVLRMDVQEWFRVLSALVATAGHGTRSFLGRATPSPSSLWEELDRLYDILPAGVFTLDGFERFLEDFFTRRGVPNTFHGMPRPLRILAHDLDSGEPVHFGSPAFDHMAVSRACAASLALPPFFSPVRIGSRYYIDAGAAQVAHIEAAVAANPDVIVIVNPLVPVRVDGVPTGHGPRASVRDKGYLWVANQATRIGVHALLREHLARIRAAGRIDVVLIEPEPTDGILFMFSPASFAGRRKMLEYAYRSTRDRLSRELDGRNAAVERAHWKARVKSDG
jgi:NTE family protein